MDRLLGPADSPRAVLMDFGSMARACVSLETRRDALQLQDEAASNSTMSYRAPELWEPTVGTAVDARSDVWSLGCLLWAMAWGYSPFESEFATRAASPHVVDCSYLRVLSTPQSPPAEARSTRRAPLFYARLESLARAMLATDPLHRPNMDVVLGLVEKLRDETAAPATGARAADAL